MQALEVRHLWLVTSFSEGFKTSLNKRGDSATQHSLLTKQVGFGLFGECGLNDA